MRFSELSATCNFPIAFSSTDRSKTKVISEKERATAKIKIAAVASFTKLNSVRFFVSGNFSANFENGNWSKTALLFSRNSCMRLFKNVSFFSRV